MDFPWFRVIPGCVAFEVVVDVDVAFNYPCD